MKISRRPTLAITGGLTAVALSAALATSAFAAATGAPAFPFARLDPQSVATVDRGPFGGDSLAAGAIYIGITEAQLRTELQAGKSLAEIAVANGKTRDGLIAALTQAAGQAIAKVVDQKGLGQHGPGRPGAPGGPGGPGGKPGHGTQLLAHPFAAASAYLGITEADLMARIRAGQTLAAIATATPGKSRDGLVAALVTAANAAIDKAVADGKLPADRAAELKSKTAEHTARLVDEAHKRR